MPRVPIHSHLLDSHSAGFSLLLHLQMEAKVSLESIHLYQWCTCM